MKQFCTMLRIYFQSLIASKMNSSKFIQANFFIVKYKLLRLANHNIVTDVIASLNNELMCD